MKQATALIVILILVSSCSVPLTEQIANASVPTLIGVSFENADTLSTSLQVALTHPDWNNLWRLSALQSVKQSPSQTAFHMYGPSVNSNEVTQLEREGLQYAMYSDFSVSRSVVSKTRAYHGHLSVIIFQFKSSSGAIEFDKAWPANSANRLPDVPGGRIRGNTDSSACPYSSCGLAGYQFRIGDLVLGGGADCTVTANGCELFVGTVVRSIFLSFVKKGH